MPLVLALKNQDSIVTAADSNGEPAPAGRLSQFTRLPNRSILLAVGNLEAVRPTIERTVLPKLMSTHSAAAAAQIVQAALVLEVLPRLANLSGRIEFVIAGIDPVRHIEQPGLYHLDSAREFQLDIVDGDAVVAGATAAASDILGDASLADASLDELQVLAKECMTTTKLRWPTALGHHVKLGIITPQRIVEQEF